MVTPRSSLLDRIAARAADALLSLAAGYVHPARREWIEAMRAELDEVGPGIAQFAWAVSGLRIVWSDTLTRGRSLLLPVFALVILLAAPFQRAHVLVPLAACAWLILRRVSPPAAPTKPPPRVLQIAVLAGVAICLALAAYGAAHYPMGGSFPSVSTALFVGILASYAGIVLRWPSSTAGVLRLGTWGGIGTGCLSLLGSIPLPLPAFGWITMAALVVPVGIGMWAAALSGQIRSGLEAGLWSGLLAGLIFFIGLVSLTYAAPGWLTHDPSTVAEFQRSWSPQHIHEYRNHYHSITMFLVSDNLGQASNWLAVSPTVSTIFGALGGMLGAIHPPTADRKAYE